VPEYDLEIDHDRCFEIIPGTFPSAPSTRQLTMAGVSEVVLRWSLSELLQRVGSYVCGGVLGEDVRV